MEILSTGANQSGYQLWLHFLAPFVNIAFCVLSCSHISLSSGFLLFTCEQLFFFLIRTTIQIRLGPIVPASVFSLITSSKDSVSKSLGPF